MSFDLSKAKDIHEELSDQLILAGIKNLKKIFKMKGMTLPVNLTIIIPTKKRGVHMSRLVKAVMDASHNDDYIENILREICRNVDKLHSSKCKIIATFDFPLKKSDQFLGVRLEVENEGPIKYRFKKTGITACPCSREITGIGHMQRASLIVEIESDSILDFEMVDEKLSECFSSVPSEYLKRLDEANLIIKSQQNAKFIEDVVREAVKRFSNATRIIGRSYESIHSHDAYAIWYKGLQ